MPGRLAESLAAAPALSGRRLAVMIATLRWPLFAATLLAAGCATVPPSGPGVMALPGAGKSFDQFRADDYECRNYASSQLGGATPQQAADDAAMRNAAIATVIGALAGAAIDGSSGAAVGAGTGLIVGSATGAAAAQGSSYELQRRYDAAFSQCMYVKGHQIPVAARYENQRRSPGSYAQQPIAPPPPPNEPPLPINTPPPPGAPPPPPGSPPPPPPGVR